MRLFMIADDFTGALDTGVQFAARGAAVRVVTDPAFDFTQSDPGPDVLILDGETRHLDPQSAYDVVFRAARQAMNAGFTHIYKKTDSALRGNIGSELKAVLDASGAAVLPFIPALPSMGRITRNGVQYIDGVPVAQSVFGQDPFEPVRRSAVAEIIAEQTDAPTRIVARGGVAKQSVSPGIQVYDAETDGDLEEIGTALGADGLRICAGCAGFGMTLAGLLGLNGTAPALPALPPAFLTICGSVNPVTLRQMEMAEENGFLRVHLTPEQKLEPDWPKSRDGESAVRNWLEDVRRVKRVILDANDPSGSDRTARRAREKGMDTEALRVTISGNLGKIGRLLLDGGLDAAMLCTGGDTLLALMREAGVSELTPVREAFPGVVLAEFTHGGRTCFILTKSGGFGAPDLLCKLADMVGAGNS